LQYVNTAQKLLDTAYTEYVISLPIYHAYLPLSSNVFVLPYDLHICEIVSVDFLLGYKWK